MYIHCSRYCFMQGMHTEILLTCQLRLSVVFYFVIVLDTDRSLFSVLSVTKSRSCGRGQRDYVSRIVI